MDRLEGTVAVVTGAASGIGAATAQRLAAEGATVATIDVTSGVDYVLDVRDEAAIRDAFADVVGTHGRLDSVVHCAGVAGGGPVHVVEESEWDRVVDINLKGTFLVDKHASLHMLEANRGSIVNIASIEGIEGTEGGSAYNASKGGVVMLTKCMAIDYGHRGIRVNCICPGGVNTPLLRDIIDAPGIEIYRDKMHDRHLLNRFGEPSEIAAAAAFLVSDDASFMTGQAMVVDGGFTAGFRAGLLEQMGVDVTVAGSPTDAARSLRDLIAEEAGACERNRTLTSRTVDALWASGLLLAFNPFEAGGTEPSFAEMISTWIELAWQDGSLGWIGIANLPSAAACAAYLPQAGFDEVFTAHDNRVTVGGQFFPNGMGATVDGGYRITGAWNFGSGTGHAEYVAGGFMPTVDGELVVGDDGIPPLLVAVFPRDEIVFTDGWHVQGLKGTGSFDYNVTDVFVPEARTFELFTRTPLRGSSPAFRMGLMAITAAGHASWALGVAKSTLDDVSELAMVKVRMGDDGALANRASFQRGLSHHTAMWSAARLLVLDTFARAELHVAEGGELTPTMRADLRVAATYATEASREVVQWAHLAAGTSAIREGSRLERAFRDLYTGTQHVFIGEKTYTDAARIHLGLAEDQLGL